MKVLKIILCTSGFLVCDAAAQRDSLPLSAGTKRVIIAASAVFDGKGRVLHNTRIVTEGSTILALDPKARRGPAGRAVRSARPDGLAGLD